MDRIGSALSISLKRLLTAQTTSLTGCRKPTCASSAAARLTLCRSSNVVHFAAILTHASGQNPQLYYFLDLGFVPHFRPKILASPSPPALNQKSRPVPPPQPGPWAKLARKASPEAAPLGWICRSRLFLFRFSSSCLSSWVWRTWNRICFYTWRLLNKSILKIKPFSPLRQDRQCLPILTS